MCIQRGRGQTKEAGGCRKEEEERDIARRVENKIWASFFYAVGALIDRLGSVNFRKPLPTV